ncbi:DnaB-like helicase C-terminal domain-containing protein [uncultured Prevotella sp.]|uniref:DnaB-like helicase C-terminal domain-containing protein n=1 Tax=uncultured Prevotella sp. TaxID=159272 RepID=UPI00258EE30C|nr:DnaB-like helicase C-terminal domain-containing protein [uncultured Prevotella sp.]
MEIENTHISKVMGGYRETTGKDIIATGIAELDKQIEGFGMGELVTLLGYPGDDKMNAAVRIMSYQAVDNDTPSAYFCTRETPEIIARKLLCYRCSTLPNRMLEYEINGEPYEWKHWVDDNKEKIAASPVYLYPNERLYIDEICEQCCSYAKSGVKVIYIYFDNEAIKNDAVCKLKALVSRLYIAIVLMIDVIGTRYGIDDQQPCLQDLSWCQLDEYSDMVIGFLNCDSFGYVSEEGIDIKGKMRIKVVKDRHNKQHAHFYLNYLGFTMKQFAEPPTISDSSRQIIEDFYTPFE